MMISGELFASTPSPVWKLKTNTDVMSDETNHQAILTNGRDRLAFTCWPKNPELPMSVTFVTPVDTYPAKYIYYNYELGEYEVYKAIARFDSGLIYNIYFKKEAGNLRLLAFLGGNEKFEPKIPDSPIYNNKLIMKKSNINSFIDHISKSKILYFRVKDNDGDLNFKFDLRNSSAMIGKLSELCKVDLNKDN